MTADDSPRQRLDVGHRLGCVCGAEGKGRLVRVRHGPSFPEESGTGCDTVALTQGALAINARTTAGLGRDNHDHWAGSCSERCKIPVHRVTRFPANELPRRGLPTRLRYPAPPRGAKFGAEKRQRAGTGTGMKVTAVGCGSAHPAHTLTNGTPCPPISGRLTYPCRHVDLSNHMRECRFQHPASSALQPSSSNCGRFPSRIGDFLLMRGAEAASRGCVRSSRGKV